MSSETYSTIDDAALTVGLGLVLTGVAVLGLFETLFDSVRLAAQIPLIGVVVVETSFGHHLRALVIALGMFVVFVWGLYRFYHAVGEN